MPKAGVAGLSFDAPFVDRPVNLPVPFGLQLVQFRREPIRQLAASSRSSCSSAVNAASSNMRPCASSGSSCM
jgi:hypothetical protein